MYCSCYVVENRITIKYVSNVIITYIHYKCVPIIYWIINYIFVTIKNVDILD